MLCNNAGVGSASEGQMWEHHVNDWRWSLDVNVMGAVNGINAFLPTMLAQDTEGAVVNTTSGNGGFTPMIHSAVYATTKAALTCLTECLWGQLRELDAKVTAHLLYPSTRTPGMLKTGIWQPGRNRHERYDRPGAPPADTGRDQLTPMLERAQAAGSGARVGAAVGGRRPLLRGHPRRRVLDVELDRRRAHARVGGRVRAPGAVAGRPQPARLPDPGPERDDRPQGRRPGLKERIDDDTRR